MRKRDKTRGRDAAHRRALDDLQKAIDVTQDGEDTPERRARLREARAAEERAHEALSEGRRRRRR